MWGDVRLGFFVMRWMVIIVIFLRRREDWILWGED